MSYKVNGRIFLSQKIGRRIDLDQKMDGGYF